MANFLRLLSFDLRSFLLGCAFGALLLVLIRRLRPFLQGLRSSMQSQSQISRGESHLSHEIRFANNTLRLAQEWHLTSRLFSLDEIVTPPRLLAPWSPPEAYELPVSEDISDWVIPFMLDWPELASYYGAPTLSLAEALQSEVNLAIVGQPGSGKTVALAYLATQIVRHNPEMEKLNQFIPILTHVADLILPPRNPEDLLETLIAATTPNHPDLSSKRLSRLIHSVIDENRGLLLLDGIDELSPPLMESAVQYLENLLKQHPQIRIVVAASSIHLDGLISLGFIPITLATWNQKQRSNFIQKWGELWNYTFPETTSTPKSDPLMLTGWLLNNTADLTPLELTLKVWAAYAGDALGSGPEASIEAYIRRIIHNRPDKSRPALEELAMQMTLAMEPVVDRRHAEDWLTGYVIRPSLSEPYTDQITPAEKALSSAQDRVRVSGTLPELIESGLVKEHPEDRVAFSHPTLAGYLAGNALFHSEANMQLAAQPEWLGKITALEYLSHLDSQSAWMTSLLLEDNIDPILAGLLTVARWLRHSPEKLAWLPNILRNLAGYLQKEDLPFGTKARLLTALSLSGNSGVQVLFRQMLSSTQADLRQLAALGCGLQRDAKAVNDIAKLIQDRSPGVLRAALLSLVAIEDKSGMEVVATTLLHGDESLRRAAAEALTNHPEEGHPMLEEGSTLEDPTVRRAVVFGLKRINQPWTTRILEKLHALDSQWIVQDAAGQALQELGHANPRSPCKLTSSLSQIPWLISFAAERGMGVAPGKPAHDLLYLALKEGNEKQRLAAMYYLSRNVEERAVLPIYQTYFSTRGELREAALITLWSLASAGIPLPPPIQYGLH